MLVRTFPVVAVSGARQVGKSTLLNHAFPSDTDCVVFDPVIVVEDARQDPPDSPTPALSRRASDNPHSVSNVRLVGYTSAV